MPTSESLNWHDRYRIQAGWTSRLRSYLFEQTILASARRVLEVGCGTGAVMQDLQSPARRLFGLDLSAAALVACRQHVPAAGLVRGDVLRLPFADGTYDLTYCHFLLLWVSDPLQVLNEMKRVTVRAGAVLALAEPDYQARIDRPSEHAQLGTKQNEALERQGAALDLGSRLADLFDRAGLRIVETGPLQARPQPPAKEERESEWAVLEHDLDGSISPEELEDLKRIHFKAWSRGERILDVPTYFAWGQV